ncbi:hypothetical protein BC830DRAFT_1043507, partial [Chytriomyces sp. MP71]
LRAQIHSNACGKQQEAVDNSDGCGQAFEVIVVSSAFEGKNLLARHSLVGTLL